MPYRVRGLELGPWLSGMSKASDIRLQGTDALSHGILAGLLSVGGGINTRRKEKEDKRRYGIEEAQKNRALNLREREIKFDEDQKTAKEQEKQALDTEGLDAISGLSDRVQAEAAVFGQPNEDTVAKFNEYVQRMGGGAQVQDRLWNRQPAGWMNKVIRPEEVGGKYVRTSDDLGVPPTPMIDPLQPQPTSAAAAPVAEPEAKPPPEAPVAQTTTPSTPLLGENGVPVRPSMELYSDADTLQTKVDDLEQRIDKARGIRNSMLQTKAARAKADNEISRMEEERIRLAYQARNLTRQAKQSETLESVKRTQDAKAKQDAEETAKNEAARKIAEPALRRALTSAGLPEGDVEDAITAYKAGEITYAQAASMAAMPTNTQRINRSSEQRGTEQADAIAAKRARLGLRPLAEVEAARAKDPQAPYWRAHGKAEQTLMNWDENAKGAPPPLEELIAMYLRQQGHRENAPSWIPSFLGGAPASRDMPEAAPAAPTSQRGSTKESEAAAIRAMPDGPEKVAAAKAYKAKYYGGP